MTVQIRAIEHKVIGLTNQLRQLRDRFQDFIHRFDFDGTFDYGLLPWLAGAMTTGGKNRVVEANHFMIFPDLEIVSGDTLEIEAGAILMIIG